VTVRVAFVVQRYGLEVGGGAELEARLLAEWLSPYLQIEVLTTCAVDYMTWSNHYPPGIEQVNGVRVRRFPVRAPRDVARFNRFSEEILGTAHSHYDEVQWMSLQGPDVPTLFDFIMEHEADYDLFVFFTYLYATTYLGLQLVPRKSLLFPTAHDEPWIYLDIFRSVFHLPRGFIFNSYEEERFVRRLFRNDQIPGTVLGVGIDIPVPPPADVPLDDYVLYLGRIDVAKGCDELFRFYLKYKELTADPVKLVLIGTQAMSVPSHPDLVTLGYMQDERFAWLQQAQLLILPSPHESLSLATLEAWALGVPVLVNGKAVVLKGHCQRGHGGLYYETEEEFVEALQWLRADPALRHRLAAQGKAYVEDRYSWPDILRGYLDFFRKMGGRVGSPWARAV